MPPVDDSLRSPSPQPGAPSASGSPFPYGAPAGWRPDPARPDVERYWDGRHWSDQLRAKGSAVPGSTGSVGSVGSTGSTGAAHGAVARGVVRTRVEPGDRVHRLATAAQAACALLALSLTGAVFVQLVTWRGRRPGGVAAADLVDRVASGLTGATLVGVVVVGVLALVTLTSVGEWAAAVLRHELTDAAILRQPLILVVLALGPGLFIPLLGPWTAARGLAQLWHATRVPTLTLATGLPAVVTTWLVTTLSAQILPPLVVMTTVASSRVDGDLLGSVTLAGLLLTSLSAVATVLLAMVVRQCDDHLRTRLTGH